MKPQYQHKISIGIEVADNESEVELLVGFNIIPGSDPSEDDPGSPTEVEIITAEILNTYTFPPATTPVFQSAPKWLLDLLAGNDDLKEELGNAVEWGFEEDPLDPRDVEIDRELSEKWNP